MSSPEERAVEATNALSRVDNHLHSGEAVFKTLPDGRPNPNYKPANTNNTPSKSVNDRLKKIAQQTPDSTTPSNKKGVIEPAKKITKKEKVGLDKITQKGEELDKKIKASEKDAMKNKPEGKNTKGNDDEKNGKILSPEQKKAVQNQEEKMKEAFSLPSGMEVRQEGPKWVLVGKNGAKTDITDCMNAIDEYNKSVNAENAAQRGVDGAKDLTKDTDANAQRRDGEEATVSQWLQNDVKTPDGQPLLNEADAKALAQFALSYSDEGILLDKLKDNEKENNNKDDKRMAFMQNRQQTR